MRRGKTFGRACLSVCTARALTFDPSFYFYIGWVQLAPNEKRGKNNQQVCFNTFNPAFTQRRGEAHFFFYKLKKIFLHYSGLVRGDW